VSAGGDVHDPRLGPTAPLDWLADVHEWQTAKLTEKRLSTPS
jgi:hypothetical protein